MTRQHAWQLRKRAEGGCSVCGTPTDGAFRCPEHAKAHNLRCKRGRSAPPPTPLTAAQWKANLKKHHATLLHRNP